MKNIIDEEETLILAAEDCPEDLFEKLHRFSNYEERIILSLMAHGPVLIRGGRGSGKSVLLKEAHRRLLPTNPTVFSLYLSLRHLPLLRSRGIDYKKIFFELLIDKMNEELKKNASCNEYFSPSPNVNGVQRALVKLSFRLKKRIVLFFDNAVHIGRENSLAEFFDIFKSLTGDVVSSKAAIYPGVAEFGTRYDVYNVATVIDISRNEKSRLFSSFYLDVIEARRPDLLNVEKISGAISREQAAKFLGRAVVGNMRAFVFLCNKIQFKEKKIRLNELTKCLIYMSNNYYWPLLEELAPKLGNYEPLIDTSKELAEKLFHEAQKADATSIIVHQEIVKKFLKPLEMLEYAGFLSLKEMSRPMKYGGRGARFALNLCNLLEIVEGKRLTQERFDSWLEEASPPAEIHAGADTLNIDFPDLSGEEKEKLSILDLPVDTLARSKVYPYGLEQNKIDVLKEHDINKIEELATSSDQFLLSLPSIGEKYLGRMRDVVGQAIWM